MNKLHSQIPYILIVAIVAVIAIVIIIFSNNTKNIIGKPAIENRAGKAIASVVATSCDGDDICEVTKTVSTQAGSHVL